MAIRAEPFEIDEWYHCFSRGIDKRKTFLQPSDYERYLQLLYLCNSKKTIHRSDILQRSTKEIMSITRPNSLVTIGAYALMPNHWHLLVKEKAPGGITSFLQKVGTAYAMYFNIKYEHTGNVFVKPFRSRRVTGDTYFQRVLQYIHFNPADLKEKGWKDGNVRNMHTLEDFLEKYPYSSLATHMKIPRPIDVIIGSEVFEIADQPSLRTMLAEARAYYQELSKFEPSINVKASP